MNKFSKHNDNGCIQSALYLILQIFIILFISKSVSYSATIDTVDKRSPDISVFNDCDKFTITVYDNRNDSINPTLRYLDVGMTDSAHILNDKNHTYNFSEIYSNTFQKGKINDKFDFNLKVLNEFEDAKATFFVKDTLNNYTYDSIFYFAEKIQVMPGIVDFGGKYVNTVSELSVRLENISKSIINIRSISLKYGKLFTIVDSIKSYSLNIKEILQLKIAYKPVTDVYTHSGMDFDTLIVETNCLKYTLVLSGWGVKPSINVEDIDFGAVEVNKKVCFDDSYNPGYSKGMNIYNSGTGKLYISGYHPLDINSPFNVSKPTSPDLNNMEINPKAGKNVTGICFEPKTPGEFTEQLIIKNNADGPDSICIMKGIAYIPGPHITSFNFGRVRLGDSKKGFVYLKNSGSKPVEISSLKFNFTTNEFRIVHEETIPDFSPSKPVILYPDNSEYPDKLHTIDVMIEFSPKFEYMREIKIIPEFSENPEYVTGSVFNYLRGFGFLPAISASDYEFNGRVLVNIQHPDTGEVIIKSESYSADLNLKSIEIIPLGNTLKEEFKFLSNLPHDTVISKNHPLTLPLTFKPTYSGIREIVLRIITDAYSGNENSKMDTLYVHVKGNSYNKVLSVEPLIFDTIFHCSSSSRYLKIKNISDTTEAFILALINDVGDTSAFHINADTINNNNIILKPKDSILIEVIFDPINFQKNNFESYLRVVSDVDTSTGIIRGATKKYNVTIKLPTYNEILPGQLLINNPPHNNSPEFDITADLSSVGSIGMVYFKMELLYKSKQLTFQNQILKGDLTDNWEKLQAEEKVFDKDFSILEISGYGGPDIAGKKGILCKPVFMVLLGDTNIINIKIKSISFYKADKCLEFNNTEGNLTMSYCGDRVRKIALSNRHYILENVSENPVTNSSALINYTVAIDAPTHIEIFNNFGESVRVVTDSYMFKGDYSYNFDTSTLSSGSYYIKMVSGPFSKTINIMVIK